MKETLRFKLAEPFGGLPADTLNELEKIVEDEVLLFHSFLRENYHSDTETWSFDKLPIGFCQDKITYNIISIEEIYKLWKNEE